MKSLLDHLRSFNSKERYFLIGNALGNKKFTLGEAFRDSLSSVIDHQVPTDAFCAIDYHIDWVYAALHLFSGADSKGPFPNGSNGDEFVKGQQEDIDLLVAFSSDGEHHLVFVEAKGVTNWSTSQMKSKAARLRTLFGENGDARKENGVVPHFVYTSPRKNSKLDLSSWPSWMRNDASTRYIPLSVEEDLLAVARCNEDGIEMRGGKYWKIRQRSG